MKKAMVISILCAVFLSACGNAAETAERAVSVDTSAASQTTTTVTASSVTSTKEEKDTSEATTTTRKSSQTVSETSASMETIKAKTTTKSTQPSHEQNEPQSYPRTEQPQENTQVNTTQKPAVTTTQQKQTTAKQTTTQQTTTKPATKPESTVTWSDTMKAWRKLCEGKSLSGKEQDLIRSEILEYAESFNGKKNIHVSFGIDEYDISYEKPLNLIIRNDMTDLSYAHMDSYVDADSKWLIDYAENEEEIYSIVSEMRTNCLHVIDYGLFNRWEIYSGNDMLKYASDIEFNVGFDGTAIWFLTED